jgi:hypothetical protein
MLDIKARFNNMGVSTVMEVKMANFALVGVKLFVQI